MQCRSWERCIAAIRMTAASDRRNLDAMPKLGEIPMKKRQTLGGFALAIVLGLCLIPTARAYSNPVPHGFDARGTTLLAANPPSGLVAVLKNTSGQPLDLSVLSNQYIRGVALQIHWSDLEPTAG